VVTAGLIPHYAYFVSGGHAHEGDLIFLAGPSAGSLGGSRWQVLCSDPARMTPRGATWRYDAESESAFVSRALATSKKADIKKSARVVAGGGLAVALAKEAILSGEGMTIELERDPFAALFSEGGPRAVYIIPPASADKFLACWEGFPVARIGCVGGKSLVVKDFMEAPVKELQSAFYGGM
jgi:phosphoribosylformylglycinamidine synthase